jgi:hypothetical protein
MTKGPDFSKKTSEILAKRAAQLCSNPNCLKKPAVLTLIRKKLLIKGKQPISGEQGQGLHGTIRA